MAEGPAGDDHEGMFTTRQRIGRALISVTLTAVGVGMLATATLPGVAFGLVIAGFATAAGILVMDQDGAERR